MEQEKMGLQEALESVLAEDKQLLGKNDELLSKLRDLMDWHEFSRLKNALQDANVGEILLAADQGSEDEKNAAMEKALASLPNMDGEKTQAIVDAMTGALHWGKEEVPAEAEEAEDIPAEEETEELLDEVAAEAGVETDTEKVPEEAPQETPATWDCACGRKNNTGKFCPACGKPQETTTSQIRDDSWSCPACGRQGNKGKFCGSCGRPKDGADAVSDQTMVMPRVQQPVMSQPAQAPQAPYAQPGYQTVKRSNDSNAGKVLIALVCCVVLIFALKSFVTSSKGSSPVKSSTAVSTTANNKEKSEEKDISQTAESDLSLGGMDLDKSMKDMYNKLGKESYTKNDDEGRTYYYYKGHIRVGFTDGNITSLVSDGTKSSTKRGIHEGSTLQDVISAYGDSAQKFNYDNLVLYEYGFQSVAGRDGILRFAINQDGKVEYISVRIPEAPKKKGFDTNQAMQVVADYHQYITRKQYRAAYDLLTPEMQNTMGLFENWQGGFRNTIESRAVDLKIGDSDDSGAVVVFILVARDRRPGGGVIENRFRSTVTVVDTPSGYKISSMNNKKI